MGQDVPGLMLASSFALFLHPPSFPFCNLLYGVTQVGLARHMCHGKWGEHLFFFFLWDWGLNLGL
jgi:hypothetical protein